MKDLTIRLHGSIKIGEGDIIIHQKIREALESGYRLIILDFEDVTYLDSSAVGELAGALSTTKRADGHLVLAALQKRVKKIMATMCFLDVFPVFESTEDALQVMRRRLAGESC